MGSRKASGSFKLSHARFRRQIAQSNVLSGGGLIRDWPLEQDREHTSKLLKQHGTDSDPIQRNEASLGIIKAAQKLDQGTLAGSVGADDGDDLARRKGQVKILQDCPLAARIAER